MGRYEAYLPSISTGPSLGAGPEDSLRAALLSAFINGEFPQGRPSVSPVAHLMVAAQDKAMDMLLRRYFGHTSPTGVSANQNVRNHGYILPNHYGVNDNNVESIALNYRTAEAVIGAWLSGDLHRRHVTASHPFFAEQVYIGIGVAWGEGDSGVYVVFISAP